MVLLAVVGGLALLALAACSLKSVLSWWRLDREDNRLYDEAAAIVAAKAAAREKAAVKKAAHTGPKISGQLRPLDLSKPM